MSIFTDPHVVLQEGEHLQRVKEHLQKNWGKYLLGSLAAGYTIEHPTKVGRAIGGTGRSLVKGPGIIGKTLKNVGKGIIAGAKGEPAKTATPKKG